MQAQQNSRPELQFKTAKENNLTPIIPQLSITMDANECIPIIVDSFKGSVRAFRFYLKVQRIVWGLQVGIR